MATWTRQTILAEEDIANVQSSGTKLYYVGAAAISNQSRWSGQLDTYEYDLATGVETKIMDGTEFATLYGIAWFDGFLYFVEQIVSQPNFPDTRVEVYVYRWTGSFNGKTLVRTVIDVDGNYNGGIVRMHASPTHLVVATFNDIAFFDAIQECDYYNGASWADGSLPFNVISRITGERYAYFNECLHGIYDFFYDNDAGEWKAVKFSGTGFGLYQGTLPANASHFGYTDPTESLHWSSHTDWSYYMNLGMTTLTQANPTDVNAIIPFQMPYSCGVLNLGGGDGLELYTTTTGTWSLLDTVHQIGLGPTFFPGSTWIIRADDAEVYLIGVNSETNAAEVWKRSEGIPFSEDPPNAAILYWGVNALTNSTVIQTE